MRVSKLHIIGITALIVVACVSARKLSLINSAKIATVFLPHHDLVAEERFNFLKKIQPKIKNRPLIILSTNHYDAGEYDIQTRKSDFTTRNGTIPVNQELYATALSLGAQDEPITFEAEHGVSSLLPDIAELFPDSFMLPLIIKPSIDKDKLELTISELRNACPNCVVFASVDFSHYQPYQLSEFHDKQTLRTLHNFAINDAKQQKHEVGEPHVLWAAMRWAELAEAKRFQLLDHTNSTEKIQDLDSEGTTHIFGYYQTGNPHPAKESVSFSFASAIDFSNKPAIDRFQQLGERVFWGTDTTIANIINPQVGSQRILDYLHISTVLKESTHYNIEGSDATLHIRTVTEDSPSVKEEDTVCSDNCYEIVYVYWNESSNREQRKSIAVQLIENGADLVIGNSPVLSPVDQHNNRPIIYGLGNLLTKDQKRSTSMTLSGEFSDNMLTLLPMLIDSSSGNAILQRNADSRKILKEHFGTFSKQLIDERGGLLFSIDLK